MSALTIHHSFHATTIEQRSSDGYLNATEMCRAAGKRFNHYAENAVTRAFLNALASDAGIPASQLVVSRKGKSAGFRQGTWVHPKVAIHLAQWLSPEFAVQVTTWVFDWLNGKTVPVREHARRPPQQSVVNPFDDLAIDKLAVEQTRVGGPWEVRFSGEFDTIMPLVRLLFERRGGPVQRGNALR